ncbi:MAG: chondroitinase-B domain-containing protein [Candidatus Didemnitutus sp.]|nr:chondroitinase-B domain-containing protein [Candidatus Didemnitutus sp.]
MRVWCFIIGLVLGSGAVAAYGVTRNVYNATDFNNLPTLNAGDEVILHSGNYGALNKTLVSSITTDAIAQQTPILVRAATNGGVVVTAPSQITLQGRGIVLAGIDFSATSGMRENGSTSPAWIIRTAADSRYMLLSNLRFLNSTAGDTYGHWLFIEGFNHMIEYCHFEGKLAANATVAFKRSTSEAGITTSRNHRLRYCYFGPRECSITDNGYESIRIGDSSSQAHNMNVTIERNVFYRAIWRSDGEKPNDMEIISNKTKGNKILNNTFLESYGQLTLRHGDACIVEGNFIFGGGYYSGSSILLRATNSYQTGIRVIGQEHIIRNNYLVNLNGTNLRAALCVMGGDATFTDGDGANGNNGYEAAHNAQIYNNTFIDCKEINLGYLNGSSSVLPTGVKIYNNAWQGSGSSNGIVRKSGFQHGGSAGNYLYHSSSSSLGWTGLGGTYSTTVSPAITETFGNYKRPTATSPLLNAANPTLVAATDIRNLARPTTNRDIGAFEREVSGTGLQPLLRDQVGPEFAGGPAGTYPGTANSGGTVPTITTAAIADATVGTPYSVTLQATDGDGALTWTVTLGLLPAGLALSSTGTISGTPTTSGTSEFTVRVTDVDNDSATQALAILVNPAPPPIAQGYAGWAETHFTSVELSDPQIAGPNADPDADGFPNLVEYALGMDPRENSSTGLPVIELLENEWTFIYTRPADRSDLTFTVQYSSDLANWSSATVTHSRLTEGPIETWQATSSATDANRFFRLVVTRIAAS